MKRCFPIVMILIVAILSSFSFSCRQPTGNTPDKNGNSESPDHNTFIVFDNTLGSCTAVIYDNYRVREEDKIAEIPAGMISEEIEWTPGEFVTFFCMYRINIKGINAFSIDYTPERGKDQIAAPVHANTINNIVIPKLDEIISSPDTLLSNNSYILIQNDSSFSFRLHRGSAIITPDNSLYELVNAGDKAQWTINPGSSSNYQLWAGASYISFPGSLISFEAGCVYSFIFNGSNISLVKEIELILENVAGIAANDPVPAVPSAPEVTAMDKLLIVHWTAVQGAENYEVYLGTETIPPVTPERKVPGTTVVLDGLVNKTAYNVWIKACNSTGSSEFSDRTQGIPWPSNEVPATPGRPVIIPGINQLTVTWEACGGASSYEVYISTSTSPPSNREAVSDKTSAVIKELSNGVTYFLWVRAVNSAGKSAYSPLESGTPMIPTVAPDIPSRPVLDAGSREIKVSWQAVGLAEAYEAWIGTTNNSAQALKFGSDITDTETVITGLINDTTYYVWIKAKNAAGTSGFSLPANAKPSAFIVLPETPVMPTVVTGSRELFVEWQPAEGALAYEVWTGLNSNSANADKHGADISGTSLTLNSLDNDVTYYIWVCAKNNIGTGSFSPMVSGTPSAYAAMPLNPTAAPVLSAGSYQLAVNWQAVEGALVYEVWAGTVNNPQLAVKKGDDVSGLSTVITGLTNGIAYFVWIKAKNNIGTSDFSPVASRVPSELSVAPQAPTVPAAVIGNGQITVTWTAVDGALAYEVWLASSNNSALAEKKGNDITDSLSSVIGSLNNGTTYYIWLKAKNNAGVSGFSPSVTGKPIANATTPVLSSGNGQLSVTWAAIPGADQYEVFHGTGINPPQTASQTINAPATSATVINVENGVNFNVWVRGKNSYGTGSMSSYASAKPIGNMGAVTVTVGGSGQLLLKWPSVAGADEYEVYQNTSNSIPGTFSQSISTTTATIGDLTNGTPYYFWVKPKNANGTGAVNTAASGTPIATPGIVTTSSSNQQIMLTWDSVLGAASYEIYLSETLHIPDSSSFTVLGTSRAISGLANGTTYHFWIKAVNANGSSAASPIATAKPIGNMGAVTVTLGNEQLTLNWSAVPGADEYEIYQSTDSIMPGTPTQTVFATTVTINNLTNGTDYYFWVRPKNLTGIGGISAVVSGIPMTAPAGLTVNSSNEQITLSWNALPGAISYEIYQSTSTTIPSSPVITSETGTSRTITGLTNGTTYYFWVKAVNANGSSQASSMASGVPMDVSGSLTIQSGNETITVTWTAVSGAIGYELYQSLTTTIPSSPSYTQTEPGRIITGLTNGVTYYFWIKPINSIGTGEVSPIASGKPIGDIKTVALSVGISGQLILDWSTVVGADKYEVFRNTSNLIPNNPLHTVVDTTVAIDGLNNGTTYYFWVKPKNDNGTGGISEVVSGKPIGNIGTVNVSTGGVSGQLVLTWAAVAGADEYQIYRSTTTTIPSISLITISATTTTIGSLTNGVTYNFWIKPVNSNGTGTTSSIVSGKPVGNMGTVTVSVEGNGQLKLNWSTVAGADQYEIYRNTISTIPGSPIQTVSVTNTTVSDLVNGTIYYFWIKSKNPNGVGGTSIVVSGRPIGSPEVPIVNNDYNQLLVSWAAVLGADEYEVYYGITSTPTLLATVTTETSAIISGLINSTLYYVRIRAKNSTGFSGYSLNASGIPDKTPGLYKDIVKINNYDLIQSLDYISSNYKNGDNFHVVIGKDEEIYNKTLNYSGLTVGITLSGYAEEKIISLSTDNRMFSVFAGVTLTLDENITLVGNKTNSHPLIYIFQNAYLVMNSNSKICDNFIGVDNYGTFIMNGGIIGNHSRQGLQNFGIFIMNDGEIENNFREGVSNSSTATFTMNCGTIKNNTNSNQSGGGVVNSGIFTMNEGVIENNNTIKTGGGVSNLGTFEMNGGTIKNNNSTEMGGGVSNGGTFTMNGGNIENNTASHDIYGGGGVSNFGTFEMNGGTIKNNSSTKNGGGVSNGGTFTMNGGNIENNTAIYGGGIFNQTYGSLIIDGGTIENNTAGYGGGIFNDYSLTLNNGYIINNNAIYGGGVGTSYYNSSFVMHGGMISRNIATYDGGGVEARGIFTMNNGIISGNTADRDGGGVLVENFTMNGGTISGNTANNRGGGVRVPAGYQFIKNANSNAVIYGSDASGNDLNGVPLRNTALNGHVVYSFGMMLQRNTTAYQTDYIDSSTGQGLSADGNPPYGQ